MTTVSNLKLNDALRAVYTTFISTPDAPFDAPQMAFQALEMTRAEFVFQEPSGLVGFMEAIGATTAQRALVLYLVSAKEKTRESIETRFELFLQII